jgi:hypothetical protein
MGSVTDREYNLLLSSMSKFDKKIDGIVDKVGNLSDRLIRLETFLNIAIGIVSSGAITGIIAGIIYIFKALTK